MQAVDIYVHKKASLSLYIGSWDVKVFIGYLGKKPPTVSNSHYFYITFPASFGLKNQLARLPGNDITVSCGVGWVV